MRKYSSYISEVSVKKHRHIALRLNIDYASFTHESAQRQSKCGKDFSVTDYCKTAFVFADTHIINESSAEYISAVLLQITLTSYFVFVYLTLS